MPDCIGENAAVIRERVCHDAAWLGVELGPSCQCRPRSAHQHSVQRVSARVIYTNEELMIAKHTQRVLGIREGERYDVDVDSAPCVKG